MTATSPNPTELLGSIDLLIVEDSRYLAKLMRSIIRSFGVRSTLVAYNAFEAFELLKNNHIDIVTVDLDLPEISGIELIQMIRRANDIPNPDMPILVISGDRRRATVERVVQVGANDYVAKPFSADKLLTKLTRMARLALCPATDANEPAGVQTSR
ncbi:MAG: response regulator [Pseudomonadota bacterium]